MEGDILKFLYEFYERGDYPHKSLFDILDKLPTQWSGQKSIDDLKERVARLKSGGLIEGDWSDDGFKSWGQIVEGKTFAYREHPLNARLTDKGAELVERRLEKERQKNVDSSTLTTALLTRKNIRIGWLIASVTLVVAITNLWTTCNRKECQGEEKEKSDSILQSKTTQKNPQPNQETMKSFDSAGDNKVSLPNANVDTPKTTTKPKSADKP